MFPWSFHALMPSGLGLRCFNSQVNTYLDDLQLLENCRYLFCFTSFSGHGPAQREWARTRLLGPTQGAIPTHAIPQPGKVGHTTGVYVPCSFRTMVWVLLRPTRTDQ